MQSGEWITINDRYYRLGAVLSSGAGSYGQVWEAADIAGRAVAVKLINAEAMTQTDPALHGHWRAHLEREIAFLKSLNADQSRHVVALLDHGEVDGQPALVLERLQANLGQWLAHLRRESTPPDLAQILGWAEQILDGLDVVHQAGFVYRDLKFSNLLVGDDGARLKLADFGSLKREDGDNTRSFIGTPATMAPEQVLPVRRGAEGCEYAVDYRADYYALGLLLFALLADQPTTAAQRRLGQLLALHGQEGAGRQQGAQQLGGLDDEERESLLRSVEFWTVPARSEQDGGTAALLVSLIDRLLARDPADRPADSLEIRAALDTARVNLLAAPTLTLDWNAPPPADEPPNRHPRRIARPTPRSRQRWALLAGAVGLAGVVAWAIVRPVGEIGPDRAEPLSAVIAPPTTDIARPTEPAAPAVEPATPLPPSEISTGVSSTPPATTDPPVAETPESMDDAPVAETPESANDAPVAETPEPATDAPVAKTPEPVNDAPVAESPKLVDDAPPPVRLAPAETRPGAKTGSKAKPRAVVATPRPAAAPASVEPRPLFRAKPPANPKPARSAPAPAVATDRPAEVERPNISTRPAPVERPAVADRPSVAPATVPRIAKPTPPSSTPATPKPAQRSPTTVQTQSAPRDSAASRPVAPAKPAPSVASRPPTTPKRASKPAGPVARAEPSRRTASRPEHAPALPPIKLESRTEPAPALPPIKLESRPQSAPPAPPPIELVSRSSATVTGARSAPIVARAEPKPPSHSSASSPARSADPVTQLRDNTGRAATALGDWASRTSSTVSKEVKRGLKAADHAVKQWTGNCNPADGCIRNTTQVERRDRLANRYGHTVSQGERPARQDEDEGFARPPPRQYRDDYR